MEIVKVKVVVVNDCAHVMEDLIPYLTNDFDIKFIQRSRGLWSKTFGVLWKIVRAKGDLFHVNYALQDGYLVDKFKHLDILHVHGSDVRWTIHSKKWSWIVKHNLKSAKIVLYATPDLELEVRKYRPDAIYLPTPVKTDVFIPKATYSNIPKAVYFPVNYEKLPTELRSSLQKSNISLKVMRRNVPYDKMSETLRNFDIFIGIFTIPALSKTCLEAMSCGLATIHYKHASQLERRVKQLSNIEECKEIGRQNHNYIMKYHNASEIAAKLASIWRNFM